MVFDPPAGGDVIHDHDGDAHAGTDGLAVRFRAADETIGTAARSSAPLQIMTVHHTATQNDDPDARIRAIYERRVTTNGWPDSG